MFSSIAGFLWASAPVMYAIFTIILLIIIRMWTRTSTPSKVTTATEKIGKKVTEAGKEATNNAKKLVEGLTDEPVEILEKEIVTNQLDVQFFGELFIAGLGAGAIVKYGW